MSQVNFSNQSPLAGPPKGDSERKTSRPTPRSSKQRKGEKRIKSHDHVKHSKSLSRSFSSVHNKLLTVHKVDLTSVSTENLKFIRGHVRNFLGTQQPVFTFRTGFTTLTTTGTNLTQVVAMDVTGVTAWSSLANIFDEYRVRRAVLKMVPSYVGFGASATTLAAMPCIVVVDYDDATAIASLSNAIQYDTSKVVMFGTSNPKVMMSEHAQPEGQPDLAWVTTAAPTTPFWFKFWSITSLIPSSAAIGSCFIEAEIEFRQVA